MRRPAGQELQFPHVKIRGEKGLAEKENGRCRQASSRELQDLPEEEVSCRTV
ncbi:MAG: hypothetical protein INR69_13035 [Mucilaginibacter polytrichastri]|nr:hypothetical protein [Mucilaginibacter polytrichastri]